MHAFLTLVGAAPAAAPAGTPAQPQQQPAPAGAASFATVLAGLLAQGAGLAPLAALPGAVAPEATIDVTIDVTIDDATASAPAPTEEDAEGAASALAGSMPDRTMADTPLLAATEPPPAEAAPVDVARAAGAAGALSSDSLAAVDPALRERVERVIRRMKDEHGHDVRVNETWRDQRRQDTLYAQGRSAPGQVVTWTRHSRHTQGLAADLVVDGGYASTVGYARLQRIAREEGLRTLGARDPGHVELPAELASGATIEALVLGDADAPAYAGADRPSIARANAALAAAAPAAAREPVAGMAVPARVARVAQVATVATVARVATPGAGPHVAARAAGRAAPPAAARPATARPASKHAEADLPALPSLAATPADAAAAPANGALANGALANGAPAAGRAPLAAASADGRDGAPRRDAERDPRDRQASEPALASAGTRQAPALERAAPAPAPLSATTGSTGASLAGATPVAHVGAADRVAEIQALRDRSAPRELSSLTLQVENAAGGVDRIRVDVRGASVGAELSLAHAADAERLGARVEELRQALERHGLTTDAVRVAAGSAAPAELADPARTAASAGLRAASVGLDLAAGAGTARDRGQDPQQQQQHDGRPRQGAQQQQQQQEERYQQQSQDEPRRGTGARGLANTGTDGRNEP